MKRTGVSFIAAVIVTVIFILCTFFFLRNHHTILGLIFLIFSVDCFLDVPGSLTS